MAFFQDAESFEKFVQLNNITKSEIRILQQYYKQNQHYECSAEVVALFAVLYGMVSIIAIVGNSIVLFVVKSRKRMQSVTNIFIANLAFSDVLLGMFSTPFHFQSALLQRWNVADFMCKVAPFVKSVSVNVSVFSLTLIAIDRCVAVLLPLKARFAKKVAILILIIVWLISIGSALPEAIYYEIENRFMLEELTDGKVCLPVWPTLKFHISYSLVQFLMQYVIPLSIISYSYIRITQRLWESTFPGNNSGLHRDNRRRKTMKKVVKMLIIVVSLFAFCWLPLQTYNIVYVFWADKMNLFKYINIVWLCSYWLAMSSACYNPFIYGLLNENFKNEYKVIMTSCCRWIKKSDMVDVRTHTRFTRSTNTYKSVKRLA
ncbi:LKR [Mytilus coruscus]|uniref:LKR n=1 Tax=Mytilus coruscus TaxID=42192 RepID=A0A6J8DXS2_MYTCO|nr:LKR [Mytilus coruscus]